MTVATESELCQKCDFSPEKRMKGIFIYVLEFMLTLAKLQNNSALGLTINQNHQKSPKSPDKNRGGGGGGGHMNFHVVSRGVFL